VEQARADLRLEQAYARPNLDAIVGLKRTAGINTLLAGVQFDLPLRNRNQGNIGAATAAIAVARAELSSAAAIVRAELELAERDYEMRRRQIEESLRPMLSQVTESSQIAQAAYREGGWDLLRLLDAERIRIETESLYYRALMEFRQSIAEVETAMGVAP
jgi:outer membrane protein TolC